MPRSFAGGRWSMARTTVRVPALYRDGCCFEGIDVRFLRLWMCVKKLANNKHDFTCITFASWQVLRALLCILRLDAQSTQFNGGGFGNKRVSRSLVTAAGGARSERAVVLTESVLVHRKASGVGCVVVRPALSPMAGRRLPHASLRTSMKPNKSEHSSL